jgi:transposase
MDFHILKQQGLSIRKIAAMRGVSRNTVRRALRSEAPPTGKRRRVKGAALEPFKAQIGTWLRDEITSQWTAERIFDEVQDRGYVGGRTVLKEYVREHRPRSKPAPEARFYVKPGQQLQVDWAEMGVVTIGGLPRKLYAFVAIMAWSRQLFVRCTTDMTLLTWLNCHRHAFAYFGGVPSEVLIDNLKTGVEARAGGTIRWHPSFEAMAVAYGFRPIAHFPMRPKTKGRVERIVRFARQRFFVGRDIVSDIDTMNVEVLVWLKKRANDRVHRITRERPCDRFEIEQRALKPLREYDIVLEESRVIDSYGLVSCSGVRYSVPSAFARRRATLQRRPDSITIVVDGETAAQHAYAPYGTRLVQRAEHLPPRPAPRHEAFSALGETIVTQLGDVGRRYVAAVEAKAPHAPLAMLREVLERYNEYGDAVVRSAIDRLLALAIVKRGQLSALCYRSGVTPAILAPPIALPVIVVEQRPLSSYDTATAA